MSEPLQVKVSRDGIEIGCFDSQEAVRLLISGTLKETDFYWHEGMTDWAPLSRLQASEARRQLADRAVRQRQEEAIKAEQLAQEKDKAKEEEDRVVMEAVRARLKKKIANDFRCHCCRESFPEPIGNPGAAGAVQVIGVLFVITAFFAGGTNAHLLGILGLALYWGPEIKSRLPSLCPNCRSANFSRPEKKEEQK
jgi:hypothetical protein